METGGSVERFRTETRYHFDTSRVIVNTKDCTKMVPCKVAPDSIEESCTNCKQLNSHCVHFDEETLVEVDGVPVLIPPGATPNDGVCLQQVDKPSIECNVWGEYVLARVTPESQAWICRCKYPNVFDSDTLIGDCTVKRVCLNGTLSNTDTGLLDDLVCTCDDGYVEYRDGINLPHCRTNLLFIDGTYAKIDNNKIVAASEEEYFSLFENVPRISIDRRFSRGRKSFANVRLLSPTDLTMSKLDLLKLNYWCGECWATGSRRIQSSDEYMFGAQEFPTNRVPMTILEASDGRVSDLHDLLTRPWTWNSTMGFQNMQTDTVYHRTKAVEWLWKPIGHSYYEDYDLFSSMMQCVVPIFLKIVVDPVSDDEAWYDLPWGPLFYNMIQPRYHGPAANDEPFTYEKEKLTYPDPLQGKWHEKVNTAVVSLTGLTDPTTDIFQSRLWGVYNRYIGWIFTPFPYYNTGATENPSNDTATSDPEELKRNKILYVDSYQFDGEMDEPSYQEADGYRHVYYDTMYESGYIGKYVTVPDRHFSDHDYMSTVPLSIPKENVCGVLMLHMHHKNLYYVLYYPIKSDSEVDGNKARRERMLTFLEEPDAGYYNRVSMWDDPTMQKALSLRYVNATYYSPSVADAAYWQRIARGPVSVFDVYESPLNVDGGWTKKLPVLYRYVRSNAKRLRAEEDEAGPSRKRVRDD